MCIRDRDLAGNVSNDATADELTIDTSAPTVAIDALLTNDSTCVAVPTWGANHGVWALPTGADATANATATATAAMLSAAISRDRVGQDKRVRIQPWSTGGRAGVKF